MCFERLRQMRTPLSPGDHAPRKTVNIQLATPVFPALQVRRLRDIAAAVTGGTGQVPNAN